MHIRQTQKSKTKNVNDKTVSDGERMSHIGMKRQRPASSVALLLLLKRGLNCGVNDFLNRFAPDLQVVCVNINTLLCVNGHFLRASPVQSDVPPFPHFDTACVFVDFETDTLAAFSWFEFRHSKRLAIFVVLDCLAHSPRTVVGIVVMQHGTQLTLQAFLFRIIQGSIPLLVYVGISKSFVTAVGQHAVKWLVCSFASSLK